MRAQNGCWPTVEASTKKKEEEERITTLFQWWCGSNPQASQWAFEPGEEEEERFLCWLLSRRTLNIQTIEEEYRRLCVTAVVITGNRKRWDFFSIPVCPLGEYLKRYRIRLYCRHLFQTRKHLSLRCQVACVRVLVCELQFTIFLIAGNLWWIEIKNFLFFQLKHIFQKILLLAMKEIE